MSTIPPDPPDEDEEDDEPVGPPPAAPEAEAGECPRCGAHYEPFQEYCLECGLRLPARRGVVAALAAAWRRHLPWYPGDWIWPAMLALLIAAVAAAITILLTQDNTTSATKTPVATGSVPLSTGTGEAPPPSTEPTGTGGEPPPAQTQTTPAAPPPPPASGGLTSWPAGQAGWTVVLASVPQSAGRAGARREAQKASNAGLTEVGVLDSSQFSSLHSGYYVVFSGIFNSLAEARSGLDTAKGSYPQAYTRKITP